MIPADLGRQGSEKELVMAFSESNKLNVTDSVVCWLRFVESSSATGADEDIMALKNFAKGIPPITSGFSQELTSRIEGIRERCARGKYDRNLSRDAKAVLSVLRPQSVSPAKSPYFGSSNTSW